MIDPNCKDKDLLALVTYISADERAHHLDAFPIDVWVRRILENEYPKGYPYEQYAPYNGIFQQYMFAYYRNSESGKEAERNVEA